MFTAAQINRARFFPELLPGSDYWAALAGGVLASPAPLDVRMFSPRIVELAGINCTPNGSVELRIGADRTSVQLPTAPFSASLAHPHRFIAREQLSYQVYASAAVGAPWATVYGLWIDEPTIIQKIQAGWSLSSDEKRIAEARSLYDPAEKGIRPIPRELWLQSRFLPAGPAARIEYTVVSDVAVAPASTILRTFRPTIQNAVLVLEEFSCSNMLAANDITLTFTRDEDADYFSFRAPALAGLVRMFCWVPALSEITIRASAVVAAAGVQFRFRIGQYLLTNVLRAKWNLPGAPQETVELVKGGIV